jgi:hypothetical protein
MRRGRRGEPSWTNVMKAMVGVVGWLVVLGYVSVQLP